MKLLDKFEKYFINVCIISGIIVFIGIIFLGFGNENAFYKMIVFVNEKFFNLTIFICNKNFIRGVI